MSYSSSTSSSSAAPSSCTAPPLSVHPQQQRPHPRRDATACTTPERSVGLARTFSSSLLSLSSFLSPSASTSSSVKSSSTSADEHACHMNTSSAGASARYSSAAMASSPSRNVCCMHASVSEQVKYCEPQYYRCFVASRPLGSQTMTAPTAPWNNIYSMKKMEVLRPTL